MNTPLDNVVSRRRSRASAYNVVCLLIPPAAFALSAYTLPAPDARSALLPYTAVHEKAGAVANNATPISSAPADFARLGLPLCESKKAADPRSQPGCCHLCSNLVKAQHRWERDRNSCLSCSVKHLDYQR